MTRKSNIKHQTSNIKTISVMFFCFLFSVFCFLFLRWWFRGWNGRDPVNVVVSSDERLWVLAVRPSEQRLVEVSVPGNLSVPVAGHGIWRTNALWRLSELEGTPRIVTSIGWDFLEVPIDGLIRGGEWKGGQLEFSLDNIYTQVKGMNTMCFLHVKFCEQYEWSFPETIRLLNFKRSLKGSQDVVVTLQDEAPSRRIIDPEGEESIELDSSVFSSRIREWFEMSELRAHGLTIAVRNTSREPGRAAKVARLLEHSGLRIVAVGNGEGNPSISITEGQDPKNPVIRRLARWFELPVVRGESHEERADVVLII